MIKKLRAALVEKPADAGILSIGEWMGKVIKERFARGHTGKDKE